MKKKELINFIQCGIALLVPVTFSILASCDGGSGSSNSDEGIETSASGAVIIDTARFVDPRIRPILDTFIADLEARQISANLSNITIEFVDEFDGASVGLSQGGTVAGICFFQSGLIQIDSIFISNPSFLFEVVYHELGHCVLGMEHREDNLSLMNARIPRATTDLIDEFFTEEFFFENDVLSSPGSLEPHEVHIYNLF